jgi:hypothetical protein
MQAERTYSEHSPRAATSFPDTLLLSRSVISLLRSDISVKAATALATTVGFPSASRALTVYPRSASDVVMSCASLAHFNIPTKPSFSTTLLPVSLAYNLATLCRIVNGGPTTVTRHSPDRCRFPHVGIRILQCSPQGIDQSGNDGRRRDRGHCPYS